MRRTGLDGLRGVGAILVLLLHLHFEAGGLDVFKRFYLAVDLFFILSGFVFSGAYDGKLSLALIGKLAFLRDRLRRLFPAIAVGLILGAFNFEWRGVSNDVLIPAQAFQSVMLPMFWIGTGPAFPLNSPQWSLVYELLANIVYAGTIHSMTRIALVLVVALSALLYLMAIVWTGSADVGSTPGTMIPAIPRVMYGFFAGLLLRRIWHRNVGATPRRFGLAAIAIFPLALVLLGLFRVPVVAGDACIVFLLFPPVIWITASAELAPRSTRIVTEMGDLSYPLYATHVPLLGIAGTVFRPFHLGRMGSISVWSVTTVLIVGIAWLFGRAEKAIRRRMRRVPQPAAAQLPQSSPARGGWRAQRDGGGGRRPVRVGDVR
nr:acyltransferase [Sphingomonas glacialis]